MAIDDKDRERFQRDLEEITKDDLDPITTDPITNERISREVSPVITEITDEMLHLNDQPVKEMDYSEEIYSSIKSSQNQEEFLKGDMVSAENRKKSRIIREFSKDEIKMFFVLALSIDFRDNNQKADILTAYMEKKGFVCLGTGTNRIAYKKGYYVYKIALDRRGIADNLNESKRASEAEKFLAHCYECCGVVAVSEYVEVLEKSVFLDPAYKDAILLVLGELSKEYIIGDMGYDPKNFANIGVRRVNDKEALVFLDYAYMHPRLGNEKAFTCLKDGAPLRYNSTFTKYVCPKCHAEYDYRDILWRINSNHDNFENSFLSEVQSDLNLSELEDLAIDADI